jgi:hypothetical protein
VAEVEERRHAAENRWAERALQVTAVWLPGTSTAALADGAATVNGGDTGHRCAMR